MLPQGITCLRLCCPRCRTALSNYEKNDSEIACASCGSKIIYNSWFWDARTDFNYPLDFSRQWLLWEKGKLGDKGIVYTKNIEDEFEDLLDMLGLSTDDLSKMQILEVGFGHGRILHEIQKYCPRAYGIDLVLPPQSVNLRPNSIVCGNLFNIPFMPSQFDLVICRGVIHHTQDANLAFQRIAEQVANNGMLHLFIYEKDLPKSLLLRKLLPFSWFFPETIRLICAHLLDASISVVSGKRRGIYTLGIFDILTARWMTRHDPTEVISWFKERSFHVERKFPCNYVGTKRLLEK